MDVTNNLLKDFKTSKSGLLWAGFIFFSNPLKTSVSFHSSKMLEDFLLVWLGRCAVFLCAAGEKKSKMRSDRQKGCASQSMPTLLLFLGV